jgi:glucose/mannose-6-phosphate isomerase
VSANVDLDLLDSVERLEAADPGGMLRAVATSGAQVRLAVAMLREHAAELQHLSDAGRPRSVVVAGMGGSAMAGDVAGAVAGSASPVPIVTYRGYSLPGWVGALDLVIAVSCSGETEETLEVFAEAQRRGCRLVVVASAGSTLALAAEEAGALFLPIDPGGRSPRASMWALAVPVLAVLDRVGLVDVDATAMARLADVLDGTSQQCGVMALVDDNPAKQLAIEVVGTLPMVWGTTMLGAVAAYRFMAQLAENADLPSVHGSLPEANHNQVVTLGGAFAEHDDAELFRDRLDGPRPWPALRLVLLRDADEHPQVAKRAAVSQELAQERAVPTTVLSVDDGTALERFAALVQLMDFATVYVALVVGIDPCEIVPITSLKERIAR